MYQEKVAVITGGASGIGLATARLLLEKGAFVAIVDNNTSVLEVADRLGEACLGVVCDVASEEQVIDCVQKIIEKFKRIDFLVANAGIGGSASLPHEVSFDEWNRVVGVNQTGIFLINKYVIAQMLQTGGGAIVNTSSMFGLVGSATSFAYAATKGAINQMTRSLALAYAKNNIRVNAIAPGYVDTPILAQVPQDIKMVMANQLPIGRLGRDEEIAHLICALLSTDLAFMTGSIVAIDGGYTAQ